ncbi:MAG: histidine triad nucleotide-binding protein [Planctomycetes bacterium]|nr:histidine triad nucleotide-binding protein [Planctomycetota bacterium]
MSSCIFCRIVAREIPAKIVLETELAMAFEDIHPQAPVHCLVIPKSHIESLRDATSSDAPLLGEILDLARRVAEAKGASAGGYRILSNIGTDGGQEVPHLHFHVLGGRRLGAKLVRDDR